MRNASRNGRHYATGTKRVPIIFAVRGRHLSRWNQLIISNAFPIEVGLKSVWVVFSPVARTGFQMPRLIGPLAGRILAQYKGHTSRGTNSRNLKFRITPSPFVFPSRVLLLPPSLLLQICQSLWDKSWTESAEIYSTSAPRL